MKKLEYYKSLKYRIVVEFEAEDNVYFAKFPELPGCIAHGENEVDAVKHAQLVKDEWLKSAFDAGWDIPEPSSPLDVSGRITVRTPKFLHQQLVDRAAQEGISLNQLLLTYLTQGLGKSNTEQILQKAMDSVNMRLVNVEQGVQSVRMLSIPPLTPSLWKQAGLHISREADGWGSFVPKPMDIVVVDPQEVG